MPQFFSTAGKPIITPAGKPSFGGCGGGCEQAAPCPGITPASVLRLETEFSYLPIFGPHEHEIDLFNNGPIVVDVPYKETTGQFCIFETVVPTSGTVFARLNQPGEASCPNYDIPEVIMANTTITFRVALRHAAVPPPTVDVSITWEAFGHEMTVNCDIDSQTRTPASVLVFTGAPTAVQVFQVSGNASDIDDLSIDCVNREIYFEQSPGQFTTDLRVWYIPVCYPEPTSLCQTKVRLFGAQSRVRTHYVKVNF